MEPRSISSGSHCKDTPQPPHPEPLPSDALQEKHNLFIHFPEDPNCEICKRTKVTRAACRRNSQSHTLRAAKFGDIITADHHVLSEGGESRNDQRYAFVVQGLATQWNQSYPCKNTNFTSIGEQSMEVSRSWRKTEGSHTLTIQWNFETRVKIFNGTIARLHSIGRRHMELQTEQ